MNLPNPIGTQDSRGEYYLIREVHDMCRQILIAQKPPELSTERELFLLKKIERYEKALQLIGLLEGPYAGEDKWFLIPTGYFIQRAREALKP